MKILMTGHHGYIGSVMVRVLLEAGHQLVGLDTFYFRGCDFDTRDGAAIPALKKDIRDVVPEDLSGFDAVIHLAALSSDPLGDLRPQLTYDINFRASVRLAQAAKAAGIRRFLYSSSCAAYGSSGGEMASEEAPLSPLTPYAISKVRTEEEVRALAGESFSPVFIRNATAYGVSPRLRLDLLLNNLVGWAHTTGKIRIMSDGTPWRPVVHVEDISRAFAAVLTAPREAVHNQAFNVGRDRENYQVKEVAEIVRQAIPGCTIEYADRGGPDPRDYRVSFSKLARNVPGFKPQWNAYEGAKELYAAFQRNGLRAADLEGGRKYNRLPQLRHLLESRVLDDDLRWAGGTGAD